MDKLLIVGVDSLAGSNLALALEDRFRIVGVSHDPSIAIAGCDVRGIAGDDQRSHSHLLGEFDPAWVIFCPLAAASSWEFHSTAPLDQSALAQRLAAWTADREAYLTVLSTDGLFQGPRMFHDEDSPDMAEGSWPTAARSVEQALRNSESLVVRSHLYGWTARQDSFLEQVWKAAACGRPMAIDGRRHATPLLASDLAEFLTRAFHARLSGIWHISGAERTSPFRCAGELAGAFGLAMPPLLAGDAAVDGLDQAETSLSSRRARRALELPLPMLREGLARFAAQSANGWRERLANGAGATRHQSAAA